MAQRKKIYQALIHIQYLLVLVFSWDVLALRKIQIYSLKLTILGWPLQQNYQVTKKMKSHYIFFSVSGLTYWRLNESELYHPLPDSVDSGAYLLLQEASMSLVSNNQCDWSD